MIEDLVNQIDDVIAKLQILNFSNDFTFIIKKYAETRKLLQQDQLCQNLIKGSVRAFLDVSSDYNTPVLDSMYDLEKEIDIFLKNK